LVATASGERAAGTAINWKAIAEALSAGKRETDLIGWFKRGTAMGVIMPDIEADSQSLARTLDTRFGRELAVRLDARTLESVAVRFHVYPDPSMANAEAAFPVEALPLAPGHAASPVGERLKRAIDVAGSLALLAALAPLLAIVAALIKLTSAGPVFFRQQR